MLDRDVFKVPLSRSLGIFWAASVLNHKLPFNRFRQSDILGISPQCLTSNCSISRLYGKRDGARLITDQMVHLIIGKVRGAFK
jgi:hypothetical protein